MCDECYWNDYVEGVIDYEQYLTVTENAAVVEEDD